jgi:excisionase family DNA binding protein
MNTPTDLITLEDARKLLEVSSKKLAALVRDGYLTEYKSPLDGRRKRMSRADVEKLKATWSEKAA